MSVQSNEPILVLPGDNCDALVNILAERADEEEFCVSPSFDSVFGAQLVSAGFLLMSFRLSMPENCYILLPKLHKDRSVLFFNSIHETRSAKRLLSRYELRPDINHEEIIDACIKTHGDDWITDPLKKLLLELNNDAAAVNLKSFSLYKDNRLVAGEFGTTVGSIYTSYSGFRTEPSSGTVQMLLSARYLKKSGYAFWDLGMPLDYKTKLGARNLPRKEFISLFRSARFCAPVCFQEDPLI